MSIEKIMDEIYCEMERTKDIYIPPINPVIIRKNNTNTSDNKYSIIDFICILELNNEEFIKKAYLDILDRNADIEGFNSYLKLLDSKELYKDDVLFLLLFSEEGKSRNITICKSNAKHFHKCIFDGFNGEQLILLAYISVLGRYPSKEEIMAYVEHMNVGMSKDRVIYSIVKSEEAKKRGAQIDGIEKTYYRERLFSFVKSIPIIGSILRSIYGILNVNRYIKSLNSRVENIENAFQKQEASLERLIEITYLQQESTKEILSRVVELEKTINNGLERINCNEYDIETQKVLIENLVKKNQKNSEDIDTVVIEVNEQKKQIQNQNMEIQNQTNSIKCEISVLNSLIQNNELHIATIQAEITKEKRDECIKAEKHDDTNDILQSVDTYYAIDYFDFENHFRGSIEQIREKQKIYIPYFLNKKNVIDLGCGRGEFTELLMDNNIGVTGVDVYGPCVEYMKMHNLPVIQDDAMSFLRKQNSVDGIFLGQVIEHMTIEQIIELCHVAYEKLEKNCYLIMETPNPLTLSIFTHAFYMDPSHQKPIHPLTLQYITEKAGFAETEIIYIPNSRMPIEIPKIQYMDEQFDEFNRVMKQINEDLYGSQDYALVAKK